MRFILYSTTRMVTFLPADFFNFDITVNEFNNFTTLAITIGILPVMMFLVNTFIRTGRVALLPFIDYHLQLVINKITDICEKIAYLIDLNAMTHAEMLCVYQYAVEQLR